MSGTFEDLNVWKRSVQLAMRIYSITRTFPVDERFGLISQLRRAAVSIPSNIAEGKGRDSDPELKRFLSTARGSRFEIRTQLKISTLLGYLDDSDMKDLCAEMDEVGRMINGLMNAVSGSSTRRNNVPKPKA